MAARPTLSTLNKLCDNKTKVLILGYIKSIANVNISNSDIPFQLLPSIVYYFYSFNLFNPEATLIFSPEINTTWTISQQNGDSIKTLQTILRNNKPGDKICIYPGEYTVKPSDATNFRNIVAFCESVHIIGMAPGVVLKMDMDFERDATVHLQNLIIHTSKYDNSRDSCIDLGSGICKTVSLYLEKCTFMYEDFCMDINEGSSVYINDCLFEGITDDSRSVISLQTDANCLTVIGSKFKRCGKSKDEFYTPTGEPTINNQYPCIRVESYADNIEHNVSIICIGNTFEKNDGHPIAKVVTGMDDDQEWYSKGKKYFLADNVINNCMKGQIANECRTIFFPQDKII